MSEIRLSQLKPLANNNNVQAGYLINDNGTIKYQSLEGGDTVQINRVKIIDTGLEQPIYNGGVVLENHYRCVSITSGSKITWSGNLAKVDYLTGLWTFDENITSGLNCSQHIIPIIGNVYNENGDYLVTRYYTEIPSDPIFEDMMTNTNHSMAQSYYGVSVYENDSKVGTCLYFNSNGSNISYYNLNNYLTGNNPFTISIWIKKDNNDSQDWGMLFPVIGQSGVGYGIEILFNKSNQNIVIANTIGGNYYIPFTISSIIEWHNYILLSDGTHFKFYIDGELKLNQEAWTIHTDDRLMQVTGGSGSYGYYKAYRVYSRAVTLDEINGLANEF